MEDRTTRERLRNHSRMVVARSIPTVTGVTDFPRVPTLLDDAGGEFCACEDISVSTVATACSYGYLPMGIYLPELPLLLVKAHVVRSVLDFDDLHVSKNARRYARGLVIYRNRHFTHTLRTIVDTYRDRWLIPQLVTAFVELYRAPRYGVRTVSFEVYEADTFVAGEVGYECCGVYTSLSGFHRKNGAGTVQLISTAEILTRDRFRFWDLGMEADYKTALGARLVERRAFLRRYRQSAERTVGGSDRGLNGHRTDTSDSGRYDGPWNCVELVQNARDRERVRRARR